MSDGTSLTVSLVLTDSGGTVLASGSASGPLDDWFDIHLEAVHMLASDICDEKALRVQLTLADCPAEACTCCDRPSAVCQGKRWTEHMAGTAAGPVGAIVHVNFPTTLGGQISCPGWSPATCEANLACCRRESTAQPEEITFDATLVAPPFGFCACPVLPPIDTHLLAQVYDGSGGVEDGRTVGCPGG